MKKGVRRSSSKIVLFLKECGLVVDAEGHLLVELVFFIGTVYALIRFLLK
jgi:hypothetical protein